MDIQIRRTDAADYRQIEEITREAFWNLYFPGCNEHYLAHVMRNHPDYVGELDFVAMADGKIIGNIMYAKCQIENADGQRQDVLSFGPLSVLPQFQRKGVGATLINHSSKVATEMGYKAVLIYGYPKVYCRLGFKGSINYQITNAEGKYPYSLLARELEKGCFAGGKWKYITSDVYQFDESKVDAFDATFSPKIKEQMSAHEEFALSCRAFVE